MEEDKGGWQIGDGLHFDGKNGNKLYQDSTTQPFGKQRLQIWSK